MFNVSRKYLTLPSLIISGLLSASVAQGVGVGDEEMVIEMDAPAATATPVKKVVPTSTPVPVKKEIPTSTPVPDKPTATFTPLPQLTFTPSFTPIATAIPAKTIEAAGNAPVSTGSQFSLSLNATGQGLFSSRTGASYIGPGAQVFFDWRPIYALSLGVGGQVGYTLGSPMYGLGTVDIGGRIFPVPPGKIPGGEFYLQGGMGLNMALDVLNFSKTGWPGHFHGYAGPGFRAFLSPGMALDMGVQYDFYSPFGDVGHGATAKVGLTFLFGRTDWTKPKNVEELQAEYASPTGYNRGDGTYTWRSGDSLQSVSAKIWSDPELYSLLADANRKILMRPSEIRVGTLFTVPDLPESKELLEAWKVKSRDDRYYLNLQRKSWLFGYEQDKNWNGPKTYRWRKGDDLNSVSAKIYGDEHLFPLLVDANEKRLIHPVNLRPGVTLIVPAPPIGEWIDVVHLRGWIQDPYLWWKVVSQKGQDNNTNTKP